MNTDSYVQIVFGRAKIHKLSANIRLLYLVDGSSVLRAEGKQLILEKSDIFVINTSENISIDVQEGSMAAVITIDYHGLCTRLQLGDIRFHVNSRNANDRTCAELRQHIQNFLMAYASNRIDSEYEARGYYNLILHTLITHFMIDQTKTDSAIDRMLHYINSNYSANLSLNEISGQLFMSPSTASRLFLNKTGRHFVTYLKEIRLEHAREELEQTDKLITQIAIDCGFSSASSMNKAFRLQYGITPGEYRETNAFKSVPEPENEMQKGKMLMILKEEEQQSPADPENRIYIQADARDLKPWKQWKNRLLNVGFAHELALAKVQKHILLLAQKLDIEYLRIWNIFFPELMISRNGSEKYNFTFLDEILDFCVDNHLKVFFDLSQRKDITMASERQEVYSTDQRTEFNSVQSWKQEMKAFLQHILERYHEEIVSTWIFEFNFFLNDKPYYQDPDYSSSRVWQQGYDLIRSNIPGAKIAGPGLITSYLNSDTEKLVHEMLSSDRKPDIFTSVNFPYKGAPFEDGQFLQKIANYNNLKEEADEIRKLLKQNHFHGEYWITEWGSSIANRNYIHDSCYEAAFLADNILKNYENLDNMGIFYASDQLDVFTDSVSVLSGSSGLLTRNGIRKPSYYTYRFLGHMGKYMISKTEKCIITAQSPQDFRVFCHNRKQLGHKYYLSEENSFLPDELDQLFEDTEPCMMELSITIPDDSSSYTVRQRILNSHNGSILNKWIDFDCTSKLSRSDLEYLERVSVPENTLEQIKPVDGCLKIRFQMEPNEIRILRISQN